MQNFKAERPLLLIGQGAKGSKFKEYAEKYNIPILTSRLAIDLIEYNHPLYIGHPGIYGTIPAALALKKADLLFIAGCRLSTALVGYEPEKFAPNAYKIMVDVDKQELNKIGVKIDNPINSDAKEFFNKLLEAEKEKPKNRFFKEWIKQCQFWKEKYQTITKEMENEKPINVYYFTERLTQLADSKDIILVDTGSCFHVVTQGWKIKKDQKFITTGGLSSMGWWAASLGASVIGNTICITGDGSLQMNIQELATVKHYNLPIKIFVWNNNGYGLIRQTQKRYFNRFIGESPETGVWCPPLYKIARAYGIQFFRTDDPKQLDFIIKKTLNYKGPVLCEIIIPYWQELIRPNDLSIVQSA